MFARLCSYANAMLAAGSWPTGGPGIRDTVARRDAPASSPPSIAQWDSHRETAWRECLFGVFGELPGEVLVQIAGYLRDCDLASWSRIGRGAHGVLRREYLGRRMPEALSAVVTLHMLEQAARDILGFAHRPGRWLAALARQLPLLERSDAAEAFALLLDAAERLPLDDRSPLLQQLAIARYQCAAHGECRPIGPKLESRLFLAVISLHGTDGGQAFSAFLTHCSDNFAHAIPSADWDAIVSAMPSPVQAKSLAAVQARADRLGCLPHAAFLARLEIAMAVPCEDRHLALAALALPNAYLDGGEASRRFAVLLPAVQSLALPQQPVCHAALAYLVLPMPAHAMAPAWRQLLAAMPALAPFDGAGEVLRGLHVGIAFMTPDDGRACRQQLEDYRGASTVHIASLPGAAVGVAEPVRRHGWDVQLQTQDVDFRICLPFRATSPGSQRARAYQAMTQRLHLEPAREALWSPALRAARVRADATRLDPGYSGSAGEANGVSLDPSRPLAAWTAVLQRIGVLPAALRTEPLGALARASARSVLLSTPRVVMAGRGAGRLAPPPMERFWDAWVRVVQRLPLPQQIDLANDIAPLAGSPSALKWSTAMAAQAPPRYKAAMLMQLVRRSTEWGHIVQPDVWHAVLHAAVSLPPMPRVGVLRLLRQTQPDDGCPGWSPSEDKALLASQWRAVPGSAGARR